MIYYLRVNAATAQQLFQKWQDKDLIVEVKADMDLTSEEEDSTRVVEPSRPGHYIFFLRKVEGKYIMTGEFSERMIGWTPRSSIDLAIEHGKEARSLVALDRYNFIRSKAD